MALILEYLSIISIFVLGFAKDNDDTNIAALKTRGGLARQEAVDGKGPLLRVRLVI